ncbi:MAG TPA: HD domain-containing protein [Euryarchaeota archaeon]|nr:HD domain-containing protein [Euryarchaeota archaeon]HIQ10266.1 HD domain-containing protein [Euryarchaeota archaeon]
MHRVEDLVRFAEAHIEEPDVKDTVLELLRDPTITFAEVEPRISIEEAPAAPRAHHSYPGGLIDHTLGVAILSKHLTRAFSELYGYLVKKDYVIAAALLHDLFKYYQYEYDEVTGGFRQREDWYLQHDFALIAELSHRKAPEYLIRVCAEAHGFNVLATPEGQVVHLADSTDAKFASRVQDVVYRACIDLERETDGKVLAVKAYYSIVRKYSLYELSRIAQEKGTKELRAFIRKELGV